ncbi:hypothetical protein KPH14_004723 [Odynerus spinipes]|uniref:Secreted protein n=1 Tax=Odynerus spinipes TaxID=1348599 RepID=A0AAD9RMC6_9HYME|nr:hypothetical protein KPH14_004723 [Odynerus spinipes]
MAMAVVVTMVATVVGAVVHAVKEAQAMAASRGEVARIKGTNPINGNPYLRPQCKLHCNRWFPAPQIS